MNMHQLILVGRATKDAEEVKSKSDKSFAKFSVAVNEFRGKGIDEKAYFYDVLVFGKSAESAVKNVKKGDVVMAMGKPEIDVYISAKDSEAKGQITLFADSWKVLK